VVKQGRAVAGNWWIRKKPELFNVNKLSACLFGLFTNPSRVKRKKMYFFVAERCFFTWRTL